jgi:steroid 5-alpha reductase family enzyme
MTTFYLQALLAIAVSLSILMTLAWVVQQRSGNFGWVDTIWTSRSDWWGRAAHCGRSAEPSPMRGNGWWPRWF